MCLWFYFNYLLLFNSDADSPQQIITIFFNLNLKKTTKKFVLARPILRRLARTCKDLKNNYLKNESFQYPNKIP